MKWKSSTVLLLLYYVAAIAAIGVIIKSGRISAYALLAIPLVLPAIYLVFFRQDLLIKFILIVSPLVWGFGHINFGEEFLRLNLPILFGVLIVLMLGPGLSRPFALLPLEQIRIAVLVYASVIFPSVFFAGSILEGMGVYLRILSPLLFMISVVQVVTNRQDLQNYLRISLLSLVSLLILLLVAYVTDSIQVEFGGELRIAPLGLSPQQLSYFLLLMIAPALYLYYYDRKPVYILIIGFLFGLMYLTKIRTSWVGGAYFLLASFLVLRRQSWLGKVILVIVVILALVNVGEVIDHFFRYIPFSQIRDLQEWDDVLSGRLSVAQVAISYYLDSSLWHKMFGIGLYKTLEVTQSSLLGASFGIHGDYLAVLVESGVIGLIGFMALLYVMVRNLYRLGELDDACQDRLLSRLGLILFQVFLLMAVPGAWYTNVLGSLYFYFFIGLALAQYQLIEDGDFCEE